MDVVNRCMCFGWCWLIADPSDLAMVGIRIGVGLLICWLGSVNIWVYVRMFGCWDWTER